MTPSPRHAHRSGAISTSTIAAGRIRALTAARPITPISPRCPSAWQLNPAEAPPIDAENLFRQPGPRQTHGLTSPLSLARRAMVTDGDGMEQLKQFLRDQS